MPLPTDPNNTTRDIQAVTRQNSEPNWIAYMGVQLLLRSKEEETPGQNP
jgi:hypothetical protein